MIVSLPEKWEPRLIFGVALLLIQVFMIGYARFDSARYFCWAPHDSMNDYVMEVTVNGRVLTAQEIWDRYRRRKQDVDPRSIRHLTNVISRYETTYGKDGPAEVTIHYKRNGIPQKPWHWPQTN